MKEELMIIKCKKCNESLSQELKLIENEATLCNKDGENVVPKGYYWIGSARFAFTDITNKIVINTKDLRNYKPHTDDSKLSGCCGYSGIDGINLMCKNGHEIATLRCDCWMPHTVFFETNLIQQTNV
ncbi:MAG: hypothetical protein ABL940_12095 [Bacteroidia bacterium]